MKVFISYSSKNRDVVKSLAADLETAVRAVSPAAQYKVWFDQEITGGHDWWNAIIGALQDCDLFLFALSPQSLESDACDREWHYAHSLNKRILPIWVAGEIVVSDLDPILQRKQIVDYRVQDKIGFQKLLDALKALEPPSAMPNPLPPPPEAPIPPLSGIKQQLLAERLDMDAQWSLLGKLKHYLMKPDDAADAYRLLLTLKEHPSSLNAIAREIDTTVEALPLDLKVRLGIRAASATPPTTSVSRAPSATAPPTPVSPSVRPPALEPSAPTAQSARRGIGCNVKLIGAALGVFAGYVTASSAQSCVDIFNCENYFSVPLFIIMFVFFAGSGFLVDWVFSLFTRPGSRSR
jgi:hypothetical protein